MRYLNLFTAKERNSLLNKRKGETKFGEHLKLISNLNNIYEEISNLDVQYVIFGIEEDLGVKANYGKTGTYKCWSAVKKVLLNIQSNLYTHAEKVLILGELSFNELRKEAERLDVNSKKDLKKLREMVELIDKEVSFLVSQIIRAGKIPIVIGGGHNNSYGLIKGSAIAYNSKVNALNIDAHADFRPEEGRHSGNGFSYAYVEGFLKQYYILGLQENYCSETTLETLRKIKTTHYTSYESLEIRRSKKINTAMSEALAYVSSGKFGLEIDCDTIENTKSSAQTPSGFSTKQIRRFTSYFGASGDVCYLHICEAIPSKKSPEQIGKLITYLITDFIRANAS